MKIILHPQKEMKVGLVQLPNLIFFSKYKMDNFISLSNDEIIIFNILNTKIYKYFLNYYKNIGFNFFDEIKELKPLKQYEISKKYCKSFKYNYCLCYRQSLLKNSILNEIKDFDNELFTCCNNKKIIYNLNNFNFINPIYINKKNKLYPINIFNFYRQEYIPFIIKEEFLKIRNNYNYMIKNKLKKYFNLFKNSIITNSKNNQILLYKYFNKIKYNFNNSYYNDLKKVFTKSFTSNANNYSLILSII